MVQIARPRAKEMSNFRVEVIDGPLPADFIARTEMEPQLVAAAALVQVTRELMDREPLFHRPEFGFARADFEKMTAPEFWEVGASGRRYSRKFVLDTLEQRYQSPTTDTWEIRDFHCATLESDTYLVTYTLLQGERLSRRSSIWKRFSDSWKVVFHQGTLVSGE